MYIQLYLCSINMVTDWSRVISQVHSGFADVCQFRHAAVLVYNQDEHMYSWILLYWIGHIADVNGRTNYCSNLQMQIHLDEINSIAQVIEGGSLLSWLCDKCECCVQRTKWFWGKLETFSVIQEESDIYQEADLLKSHNYQFCRAALRKELDLSFILGRRARTEWWI